MKIPLTKPDWGKAEQRAVVAALKNSNGTGDGYNTKKLVTLIQKATGAKFVLPVTSCTHGLELAVAAFAASGRLKAGDEVIVPSFTMTSTANCVVLSGAKPVFADIDPVFYNIDPADIAKKISPKTRGIIVVHYAGNACDMEKITRIAKKHHLWVIEDAAHAVGAYYKNKMLGTLSDIGVYSFHGTKNLSCGEGGAVMTNNQKLADIMEIYRANGTNRKQFLEGRVDKYSWVGHGTSFFLSDILAAIMTAQFQRLKAITAARAKIAAKYLKMLQPLKNRLVLPRVPEKSQPNWHIFAVRLKNEAERTRFIQLVRQDGVEVSSHYVPLHSSFMGRSLKADRLLLQTDKVAATLVRLPIYSGLTDLKVKQVVSAVKKAVKIIDSAKA